MKTLATLTFAALVAAGSVGATGRALAQDTTVIHRDGPAGDKTVVKTESDVGTTKSVTRTDADGCRTQSVKRTDGLGDSVTKTKSDC